MVNANARGLADCHDRRGRDSHKFKRLITGEINAIFTSCQKESRSRVGQREGGKETHMRGRGRELIVEFGLVLAYVRERIEKEGQVWLVQGNQYCMQGVSRGLPMQEMDVTKETEPCGLCGRGV